VASRAAEAGEGAVVVAEPGKESLDRLTRQLWDGIPLSAAAGIEVMESGPDVVRVRAPFPPNRNYHGTVFGGSIAVVGIVAGWLVVDSGLREAGHDLDVVIQTSTVDYLEPVHGTLLAEASRPEGWEKLLRTVERFGRGRVEVVTELTEDSRQVARHRGVYAALTR
jgi:thioesterase domain-containing protein